MASLGCGGIGRFARKKQQLSQQDAPSIISTVTTTTANAMDSRRHGEEDETEFDTATTPTKMKIIAPANNNSIAAVRDATTDAENDDRLLDDHPETPFNSFAHAEFGPPATPGGGGGAFSAIGQMFDTMGDDDNYVDEVNVDDNGRSNSTEGMFVDTTPASNGGGTNVGSNFGQQGLLFGNYNFQEFNAFDESPNVGEEHLQSLDPRTENAKSPTPFSTVAAATASSNNGPTGPAQCGGIGIFAKKRADAPNTTGTSPNSKECFPTQHPTKNDVTVGTMNSMKELLSVADLSRFDTDLVSKNTESSDTLLAKNPPDVGVVVPSLGSHHGGVEVSKTIPLSGDDNVDDDLTIETTVAEGVDLFSLRDSGKVSNSIECEPCTPTKSPYFLPDSMNNQAVVQTDVHAIDTTSNFADLKEATKSASAQGGGGAKLSAPRVSLSPPPGLDAMRPGFNNQNQAASYSLASDDDNSIVIPGIPVSVANMNVEGNGATSGTVMGSVGLRSVSQSDSTNHNSWSSNMDASAEEGRIGLNLANGQKSSTKNATTQSAGDRPITTIQSRGINKLVGMPGKVKFTSAATSVSSTTNSFKKSKVAIGAPFANSELVVDTSLNSTAITPDHRQLFLQDSVSMCSNGRTITPRRHEVPAAAPTPEASIQGTAPTADFQSIAMEEDVPSKMPRGRSSSQTIHSPTQSATAGSVPTKAGNTASNEGFDELLSEFVFYVQESADIYEKGQRDLLELEVDLSHAFASVLRYKDEYTTLLSEIDCVQAKAEYIMSEISN